MSLLSTRRALVPLAVVFLAFIPLVHAEAPGVGGTLPSVPIGPPAPDGQPQPATGDQDLDRAIDDANQQVRKSTGGSQNPIVPAPRVNPGGIDKIAVDIGDALAENWALTTGVTITLSLSAITGMLFASRYIDPKIALRSPERSMLYGFVKGNPGVHLKQLSTEFKMKTSTVLWHVRKLEAADLVRSKKANGYRVFYPVSGGLEARKVSEAVTALSNGNARSIFAFITDHPGGHPRALTAELGINPGTVRWHLKKMREAGLIAELLDGRGAYHPTELGLKAFGQLQSLPQTLQRVPVAAVAVGTSAQSQEVPAFP